MLGSSFLYVPIIYLYCIYCNCYCIVNYCIKLVKAEKNIWNISNDFQSLVKVWENVFLLLYSLLSRLSEMFLKRSLELNGLLVLKISDALVEWCVLDEILLLK